MEKTRHRNTAFFTAILLLCLVLISTAIVSGMLARFTTGDSASDNSRVAKFVVTGTFFSETINLDAVMKPGDSQPRSFEITNSSEVSVEYAVKLRNTTKNLPLSLKIGTADQTAAFNSADGYTYTATLAPNGANSNFAFELVWPATENDVSYSGKLDNIAVTVTATQID